MTRSMTGHARAKSKELDGVRWTVEIHSVNRKGLDLHIQLSKELFTLEQEIRKAMGTALSRGKVSIKIQAENRKGPSVSMPMLKQLKSAYTKIAKELKLSTEEITLPFLLQRLEKGEEEELSKKDAAEVMKTFKEALQSLIKMKETEGKALSTDLRSRIKQLATHLSFIEKQSQKSPAQYEKKLRERLKELCKEAEQDERVLKEIALFSEKVDVTEEITRLKSHFDQIMTLLTSKEESVGRTLEFLTQEMLREFNTIGSKTPELAVTKKVIACKAELEKIREQVQNIE